jgi:inhibitor of cysteine peptidase
MRNTLLLTASVVILAVGMLTAGCTASADPTPEDSDLDQPVTSDDPTPTPDPEPQGDFIYGEAVIDTIDILMLESFPVQVHVRATGSLPDGCTEIDRPEVQQDGDVFLVKLITRRPAGAVCTQVLTPFEQSIPLEVVGLKAGTYLVVAGELEGSFTLTMDNTLE